MSREIPIAGPHFQAARGRFRNERFFSLRNIWDSLSPTVVFGPTEYSDSARPQFHMSIISPWVNPPGGVTVQSCSITSTGDLAIEAVQWGTFRWDTGAALQHVVTHFTASTSHIPWLLDPFYWSPWVRPTYEWGSHKTVGISGRNLNQSPSVGWQSFCELDGNNGAANNVLYYDPPLILPAGMFHCLQSTHTAGPPYSLDTLMVNFRYREI